MEKLPHWVIRDNSYAIYDTESVTAIEATNKLYHKVNEIVEDYNKFVDNINKHIDNYENGLIKDYEVFKVALRQEFQDFIDVIDLKIKSYEDIRGQIQNELNNGLGSLGEKLSLKMEEHESKVNLTLNNYNETIDNNFNEQNNIINESLNEYNQTIETQNNHISETIDWIKSNVNSAVETLINQMIENNEIQVGLIYSPNSEQITITLTGDVVIGDGNNDYTYKDEVLTFI